MAESDDRRDDYTTLVISKNPEVQDMLPLSQTNFLVLAILSRGPNHGYALLKNIIELSDGNIALTTGNLYVGLKRYALKGLIEEIDAENYRQRVYQITNFGQEVLEAEAKRLEILVEFHKKVHS